MTDYLNYIFKDTPEFVNTFDELPLWSASFGLLLLKHIELKPNLVVLDIGSGTGFPLLELAQRLGPTCTCTGIDPWANATHRAKEKIRSYEVPNVSVIACSAEQLPFADNTVDLVVSNLGINNFDDPAKVFNECARVLKPGGKLALTTNVYGHFSGFYRVFEDTLRQLNRADLIDKLKQDEEHRGTIGSITSLFTDSGLAVTRIFEEKYEMRFLDGTAFLNHYFIKLGWLASWKAIIPREEQQRIFAELENNLNVYAAAGGGLNLAVPMAYVEGQKI